MKRMKKILVGLMAMVMLLGMGIIAQAADKAPIKSINVQQESVKNGVTSWKNASSVTIYTNDPVIVGGEETTSNKTTLHIVYTWDSTKGGRPKGVTVSTSNRGIVTVDSGSRTITTPDSINMDKANAYTATVDLTLNAVSNGKATITIKEDGVAKPKTKKLTVTVKTWADAVSFGSNVEGEKITLAGKGSKLNLDASVTTANASNTKLTYAVTDDKGDADKTNKDISCDAKGNITLKKDISAERAGYVSVFAADSKRRLATVEVLSEGVSRVKTIKIAPDFAAKNKNTKVETIEYGNVSYDGKKLYLMGNKGSDYNTYQLNCIVDADASMSDLVFTSNKPAIATVDAKGKITAVGNGTATITVSPKLGNSAKATLSVVVDTRVEYVNVSKANFTIAADNKAVASINATVNSNAKTKTIKYQVTELTDAKGNAVIAKGDIPCPEDKNGIAIPTPSKTAKTEIAKYISVDAKGNVKAKQECTAVITATAIGTAIKDHVTKSAEVTVTANDPIAGLVLSVTETGDVLPSKAKAVKVNNISADTIPSVTAYRTSATPNTVELSAKHIKKAGNEWKDIESKSLTWTSNKTSVATVDGNGKVTLKGNGTAKITATATDGSKKNVSINLTVKTDAYEITTPANGKLKLGGGVNKICVASYDGTKPTASLINASVNADASVKGVTYDKPKVQIGDKVTITTKDSVTGRRKTAVCTIVSEESVAERLSIVNNGVTLESGAVVELKAGEAVTLRAADGNNVLTDATWSLDPDTPAALKSNVTVNRNTGVVTAKKATGFDPINGKVVTVTVKATSKDGEKTGSVKVAVGEKDATVLTTLNKSFTTKLNEENRDYTGVKATFTSKTNTIKMDILEPAQNIKDLEDTGLVAAMNEVAETSALNLLIFDEVVITDSKGNAYTISRTPGNTKVSLSDGSTTVEDLELSEAVGAALSSRGRKTRIQDLNGENYTIALGLHYQGTSLKYNYVYTTNVSMAAAKYDTLVDSKISNGVEKFNAHLKASDFKEGKYSGIGEVKYNPASNEFDVVVNDLDVALEAFEEYTTDYVGKTLDQIQEEAKDAFDKESLDDLNGAKDDAKDIASDASSITFTFTCPAKTKVATLNKTNETTNKQFVKDTFKEYCKELQEAGADTLENILGSVTSANVTFEVGSMTYVQSYKVNFLVSPDAYENAANDRIKEKVGEKAPSLTKKGVKVAYNKSELTVNFTKEGWNEDNYADAIKLPLQNAYELKRVKDSLADIVEIFDEMAGSYENNVTKANVVVNGKHTVLVDTLDGKNYDKDDYEESGEKLLKALTDTTTALKDMDGRTATLKVTYHIASLNRDVTLVYTIKFTVEGAKDVSTQKSSLDPEEIIDDKEVIDEETDETIEDEVVGDKTDETIEEEVTDDETDETTEDESEKANDKVSDEVEEEVPDAPVVEETEINTIEE